MLLGKLTQVWISEYEEVDDHGEPEKNWKYKGRYAVVKIINEMSVKELNSMKVKDIDNQNSGIAYLNLQQDVNELDRKSTGEVDYSIYKGRTNRIDYNIKKGDGISLTDISGLNQFKPDYIVKDCPRIGNSIMYRLEKYNGQN